MRQISVFTSTGVGGPLILEHEPERQCRKVIQAAEAMFKTNGLWPPEKRHLSEGGSWLFTLDKVAALQKEINRLKQLL